MYWVNGYWCGNFAEAMGRANAKHDIWKCDAEQPLKDGKLNATLSVRWRTML